MDRDETAGLIGVGDLQIVPFDLIDIGPGVEGHLAASRAKTLRRMRHGGTHIHDPDAGA